jgi:hypothetical protein
VARQDDVDDIELSEEHQDAREAASNDFVENARWEEIQAWRSTPARGLAERLPEDVRDRAKQVAQKAGELWDKVPGNDALEKAFASAIKGGFDMALDITESTIKEHKVVERVTKGLPI